MEFTTSVMVGMNFKQRTKVYSHKCYCLFFNDVYTIVKASFKYFKYIHLCKKVAKQFSYATIL